MGSLAVDTEVRGGDGRYAATPSEDWRIWGPMGGYAAALALRAAAAEVPDEMRPASFSCQFFTPAAFEPVDLEVEVRRRTRRTASLAVRMIQQGRPILDAQAWFAVEDEHIVHDHAPLHPHGDPYDHPARPVDDPPIYPFWENLETRTVSWIDDWETYEGGEPEWDEWLRFRPDAEFSDPVLEATRLLVLADLPSFPAATRAHPSESRPQWMAPNLDLSVQFHRLDDLGDWLLCHGDALVASRGLIGFRSAVWTRRGRLAASGSGQLLTRVVQPNGGG